MLKKLFLCGLLLACFLAPGFCQRPDSLVFSGYAEAYYGYDFSRPANHERPFFIYNHKRHNEISLNLLLARAAYASARVRGALGVMFGTYPHYNLAAEPGLQRLVYEASLGVRLSERHPIWLDVGVMPSHIGFESAIGADCWTLSRSLMAENSPYFEAGARLSYTNPAATLYAAGLVLNGWQRVWRPDGFQRPSFGLQLTYRPSAYLTLNYSNFLGYDRPDSLRSFRHYHNFYAVFAKNRWGLTAGLDLGSDLSTDALRHRGTWLTPVVIARRQVGRAAWLAVRAEYFRDKTPVLLAEQAAVMGFSVNLDRQLTEKVLWRTEYKVFRADGPLFKGHHENHALLTALCLKI